MAEAAARDAVWIDVLPSMRNFAPELAKGATEAADKEGRKAGTKFGTALLAGVAVVAGGAAAATKALYGIGETFDDVSDTIRVGTGATGDQLDKLVESAKQIGTRVPVEYSKIGPVVADVNTRLGLTGPILEKVSSQYLEAGRILGEEVDIQKTSAAFNVFKLEGEEVSDGLDHLFRVSQATGIGINDLAAQVQSNAPAVQALGFSFEDTANMVGALDKAGLNSSKMMAGMSRSLVELAKDGEEPADAFRRVTGEIEDLVKSGDKAGAVELASKVFGTRNASQFVGAIESGTLALDDLSAAVGATDDTILGAGEETMDFAEQWQLFKNQVMEAIAPAAERLFGIIGDGMAWMVDTGIPAAEALWASFQSGEGRIGAVKTVFQVLWDILKPVGQWMIDNKATVAAFAGSIVTLLVINKVTSAVRAFNLVLRANPIGVLITVIALLVASLVHLYRNNETARRIMDSAWKGIKSAIDAVVTWFVNTAWPWMREKFVELARLAYWLWREQIKPAWNNIKEAIKVVVGWVRDTAWPWMRDAFNNMSTKAGDIKDKIVNAWDRLKGGISSGWDGIKRIFDKFKGGLQSLQDKFGTVKDGIGRAWSYLGGAIARPINTVIDTVNRFLDNLESKLNAIPGVKINLPTVPHVPVPAATTGAASGNGRNTGSGVALAAGGVLPGYSPGRDNMHFYSPDHGWLHLAGGEPVMRPEFGRAVGRGWIDRMNRAARTGGAVAVRRQLGFAGGGTLPRAGGGTLGDAASAAGGWLMDLFTNPGKALQNLADKALARIGNSWPAQVAVGTVRDSIGKVTKWVKEKLFGGEDGPGGLSGPVGPALGWRAIWGMVKSLFPDAILTSAVRNSVIAGSNGVKSLHASGRAVDFAMSPTRMIAATKMLSRMMRWTELIHTPAGMWQQNRGVNTAAFMPITRRMHRDHVHAALSAGGILDPARAFVADSGALLAKGINVLDNRTGAPEPLRRADLPTDLSDETIEELREAFASAVDGLVGGLVRHVRQKGDD